MQMPHDKFITSVVEPINMMSTNELYDLLRQIDYHQFTFVTQKSWDLQDKMPEQDEDKFDNAYQETLPIVLFLEKILNARLQIERDLTRKNKLSEQLLLVSLILSPHKMENVAKCINDKRNAEKK